MAKHADQTPPQRGIKRSSWQTYRRRLVLVRTLLRAPARRDTLIAAVHRELGDEGYPAAAADALKNDFQALRQEFGCHIRFNRSRKTYSLEDLGDLALLDLPDSCFETLSFLEASFPRETPIATSTNIHDLLSRVVMLLPTHRQEDYRRATGIISMASGGQASETLDPTNQTRIKRAINHRQELEFEYIGIDRGSAQSLIRRHRVAPYGIFFRDGHAYLDATLLDVHPPGLEPRAAIVHYRINRILPRTARVLPTRLPPTRQNPPLFDLEYRLVSTVARRRDLAAYFPETRITYHEDGSATVTARVSNLWQARQILLRYGDACQVINPPELVELFRATARGLSRLYLPADDA